MGTLGPTPLSQDLRSGSALADAAWPTWPPARVSPVLLYRYCHVT